MISKRSAAMYIVLILIGAVFHGIWGSSEIPLAEASGFEPFFSGGDGTAGNPYRISNVTELQWMGNTSNLNKDFVLVNDINASATKNWNSGAGFVPIGTSSNNFQGSLDGNGYNITNLYINRSNSDHIGLFGYIGSGGVVKKVCLIDNDVTGRNYVGGLVGSNDGTVTNSCTTGNTNGASYVGGLVGYNENTVTNSHYNINGSLINNDHYVTLGGLFNEQYQDWYSNGLSLEISDYGHSLVPNGNYYEISSVQGLKDLLGFAENSNYRFRLASDIDLSPAPGLYIPYLASKDFDGRGYNISNLRLNQSFSSNLGMFGETRLGSAVSNLKLMNINIFGSDHVGGLVGSNDGTVTNCYATGATSGGDYVGGLVGGNIGTVSNCYATGTTSGIIFVGGLVGANGGTVSNCYATGNVSGSWDVGGLVGGNFGGTVTNCYATGTTSGIIFVGGLLGYNFDGAVTDSYAHVTVTRSSETYTEFGGFVGMNFQGRISRCYSTGGVTYSGTADPTNKGFAGSVDTGGDYEMSSNFWDIQTSGQTSTAGLAIGRNTEKMKVKSTFTEAGWDFEDNWEIVDTVTYPILRWQEQCPPTANAGPDLTIGTEEILYFNGSGSTDNQGIINFTWTFTDIDDVTLFGVSPSYRFDNPGIFVVTLKVINEKGNWNWDSMAVTVIDITPPVADAGPNETINESDTVTFNGSKSSDNVGIVKYTWTFKDGIGDVTLFGEASSHTFEIPGIYLVTLNVTDAVRLWGTDTMTVTVNDITPPVAEAGPDQIVVEGDTVSFMGIGSSDNVGIVNYTWTFYDGEPVTLYGLQSAYTFNTPGLFVVTLNVSDAAGYWSIDTMTVTILDIIPPVADAGPDQVVDEGSIVTFNGSESRDSGGIINWTWSFYYENEELILFGEVTRFTFDIPGSYNVILYVTDAAGYRNSDFMNLTVRDLTPPVADAGPDQVVDEGVTVTFDGGGSNDNLEIVKYEWSFDHGSKGIKLQGISPSFTFEIPGIYNVRLNVSDAAGHLDHDLMTLTVRDITAPVAVAGDDMIVAVGSTVILNGSLSTDNGIIERYSWTFIYDGEEQSIEGSVVDFVFEKGGVYDILLAVIDQFNNIGEDRITITVMDTGIVKGIVLDEKGDLIEGAIIDITASNGEIHTYRTGSDGSFSIEVYHGSFTWKIMKEGYKPISGTGSVNALEETVLDLSETPLIIEENAVTSILFFIIPIIVIVLIILGIAIFLISRRKDEPEE